MLIQNPIGRQNLKDEYIPLFWGSFLDPVF